MLKAVVVDDEPVVLTGLTKKFDWGRHGIELIGTARDGLAALSLIRRLRPDIVMTDIRMPGIDGLRLVEKVAAELPHTMFIVFSGFNEFEYVRRAIGLGVVDYLEKPITMNKVEKAIARTVEKIGKEHEFGEWKAKWEAGRTERLALATLRLLMNGGETLTDWLAAYGEDRPRVATVTVLAFDRGTAKLPSHPLYEEIEVSGAGERISVVLGFEEQTGTWKDQLVRWNVSGLFGSGRTYRSLGDARRSYQEALRALRYGRFRGEGGPVRIEEVEAQEVKRYAEMRQHEEAVILSLRTGDREGLRWALNGFRSWSKERKLTPERVEEALLKLVFLCLESAKETGMDIGDIGLVRHRELHEMNTLDAMFDWMRGKLDEWLAWTANAGRETKHASLERVLDHMEERFGENLSLQELAEHVDLHPAYLSLLFKEQLGVSYSRHLTGLRMEKAKAMLREGERVHEVYRKAGYVNQRHFAEVFKKTVGMSPGQYRDLHGAGRRYATDENQ